MKRCLYCYQLLDDESLNYHSSCSKKFFGTTVAPLLEYNNNEIAQLGLKVVSSKIAVTGVQAKLSLHIDTGYSPKRFTIVGLWGEYILKPQTEHSRKLPEVEDLTMHLAQLAKIPTVQHALIPLKDGSLAYITKRADRDKVRKIAMEDMCQLTEHLTEYKYKGSYEQIAKTILKYSANPVLDEVRFYEQLLFSFLTGNADMHLKNFSLIKDDAQGFVLMPAYDMVATTLVNKMDKEELALTLNAKKRKLRREDFIISFSHNEINTKQIDRIFSGFAKIIPTWFEFISISFLPEDMKLEYIDLIKDRANRLKIEY